MKQQWLAWAQQLQSIAQAGLEFSKDKFDLERFAQIRGEKVTTGKIITAKILSVDRTPDPVKGWARVVAVAETTMTLP